ncbi:HDIG domain-containing protein [Actinocrinis puniceicyclus]|uniref:HDIG domain-containing protein n=1 Tax=Actinocrinis puniceicyclus TaxID=977794 RepID=A0A8J7WLK8_9ACTN|nr:HDIG domain-containing metalloprotein [Actinocrinis puniceicyclus]MBS2964618.1 HDIG domain-containing protein [Actinocrinis puniceicyclus]
MITYPSIDAEAARRFACRVLLPLPQRWIHTQAVAAQAAAVARAVAPQDRALLLAAAWLHDIGYAPAAALTGFHPLDGARLAARYSWPPRLTGLIAHHSGALFVARVSGWDEQLAAFPDEASPVTDALVYADQTTAPDGRMLPADVRIAQALARHGPGSPQHGAAAHRTPYLLAAVGRVQARL